MGTLIEDVQYSNGEEEDDIMNIEAVNVSYDRLNEENDLLRKEKKNLELQLRNAEEKNCNLNRDIGNLNFQLRNIKANQNRDDIISLKDKNEVLEESLARLKIKYKRAKTELKEYKGRQPPDEDSQSFIEIENDLR